MRLALGGQRAANACAGPSLERRGVRAAPDKDLGLCVDDEHVCRLQEGGGWTATFTLDDREIELSKSMNSRYYEYFEQ